MTASVVRCRCSHAQVQHTDGQRGCWFTACGCAEFRPVNVATPEARCSFSDLPVTGCAHCRTPGRQPLQRLAADDIGLVFTARRHGHCDACDGLVVPGDLIAARRDSSGYVCDRCQP